MNERSPAAVILGGAVNAVSIARSLGAFGVPVYALGTGSRDPVRFSRFVTRYVPFAFDEKIQERWLRWLEQGPRGAVLLPANDDGLELVVRNRARLTAAGYRPFEANDDVALAMLDKAKTYELARASGLAVPRTVAVGNPAGLSQAAAEIGFPCALKPSHSHRFARHFRGKAFVTRDRGELERAFASTSRFGLDVLLTEIVPGADDQLCSYYGYLDEGGRPLVNFTKRKLRQFPVGFGLACYEVTHWDDEVAALGLRFFRKIGLRGLATVEFKRDPRDGELKLIECNHRFTASNELVRIAGLDLARLVYFRLTAREPEDAVPRRDGVRLWHPVDDVRSMVALRRGGEITVAEWLRTLVHRQHFPVFRWDDPFPTAATSAARVAGLMRRSRRARDGKRPSPA